jgi:hypothetical protein
VRGSIRYFIATVYCYFNVFDCGNAVLKVWKRGIALFNDGTQAIIQTVFVVNMVVM